VLKITEKKNSVIKSILQKSNFVHLIYNGGNKACSQATVYNVTKML
jgi:hypothetical protein